MQAVVRAEIAQADGTGSTREPGEALQLWTHGECDLRRRPARSAVGEVWRLPGDAPS